MAGSKVDAAVLVPLDAHDDYVARVLADYPETFAAIAVAAPAELRTGGTRGVESLRARRDRFGFHGLRTQWLGEPGQPVTDSPALPVLRYLAEQGLLLWTYLPPDQLPLLPEVVRELPELRVVLNHLGFCPHDMQIDRAPTAALRRSLPRVDRAAGAAAQRGRQRTPHGLRPVRPLDARAAVPRPVPGDPPFRRGIRTRAPAVGFGLPLDPRRARLPGPARPRPCGSAWIWTQRASPACSAAPHETCSPTSPASPPQARQHPLSSGSTRRIPMSRLTLDAGRRPRSGTINRVIRMD